jgi:hypothetical protein
MSGRTADPDDSDTDDHRDVSQFLDADGNFDPSTIRSVTNADNGGCEHITPSRCAALREHLLDTNHTGATADRFDIGRTATRRHAKGECHHDARQVDHPPLEYERGDRWRIADD